MNFLEEIAETTAEINELKRQRDNLVLQHLVEIQSLILNMMDWPEDTVFKRFKAEYSEFEKRIMIEVILKEDIYHRYVFELGKRGLPLLRFRESLL